MSELPALPTWGVVPDPVRNVLQRLKERAAAGVEAMDTQKISGETPQNHDEAFLQMSWAAEAADRATRDYRSVFNAYTHKFHQPKPPIGELAAMQGAITQSFAKRYTPKTVQAIEALLSAEPNLDAIRTGIRALGFADLRGISDALDRAMEEAESQRGFHPWLPAADKARAASRALERLGDDEL
ncbi:hypothetical protein NS220_05180 [Microbacterium testaceum]|uniref:Uncharacterized protein n=1 Tax=Microbacterium testaceum TaxID=2033 RepID=A0A147EZ43_MICTE|nr:hypothetical protein [Microbacterium testaceum]KTR95667.1 hypothetical protein NS220_05180 [Microbacterium testaceum]